ncbi:MAG: glutamate ABC transporter substrate-binding protein [Mycobacteriales bacterium]|nr:glutamate ABC transporter substrate-binding protein [Mycobacteriales bacterium]
MKTTRLRLTAACAALALAAVGCGDDGDDVSTPDTKPTFAAGSTMEKIQKAGVLKVGTKFDQPLYGEKQINGDITGFDVEIAKIVAKAIGVKAEFQEAVSKNREPFIKAGTVDIVVATYTINDKRKLEVSFAGPYYQTGQSILVKDDNTDITKKEDLAGKRVCSVEGSTPAENVKKLVPTAKLTLLAAYGECVEGMKNDQIDAVTTDEAILLGLVSKNTDFKMKVVGEQFSEEPYGIGLAKDDKAFRDFINDAIEKAVADGTYKAAYDATVGKVAPEMPAPPTIVRY